MTPWLAPAPADIIISRPRPTSIVTPNQNLPTIIPLKRNGRRRRRRPHHGGRKPPRRPGGPSRSVGVSARWNRRSPRARVRATKQLNAAALAADLTVAPPRPGEARHQRYRRSPRPPELHRRPDPDSAKRNIDHGAAVDLTIVRPQAAAPPRRRMRVSLQVELIAAPFARAGNQNAEECLSCAIK